MELLPALLPVRLSLELESRLAENLTDSVASPVVPTASQMDPSEQSSVLISSHRAPLQGMFGVVGEANRPQP